MGIFRQELERLEADLLRGVRRLKNMERRQAELEQAILETSTALREARAELEELRALSPFASGVRRASQSADGAGRLHA